MTTTVKQGEIDQGVIDQGVKVREQEQLDLAAVHQWLASRVTNLGDSLPTLTQFPGGASNWTYRLDYPQHDFILRRPPAGTKAKSAHDMGREFRIQQALQPVFPWVPRMIGHCDDEQVIGSEFYVMERVEGIIPRKNMPRNLTMSEAQVSQLCRNMLDKLVALHQVDYQQTDLVNLAKGEGYAARQIAGWSKRYQQAKTWNVPSGKGIMAWLEQNLPSQERLCMTHNDFRFDNLVLNPDDPTDILAVLDWELATIGDPLMDVGNMLAYWIEADDDAIARSTRRQPTHLQGMMTRREVIDYYCEQMGFDADNFTFYEVYGLFRLAGIAQQIYYRYHHKQTTNPAFKNFWFLVHYLLWRCRRLIRAEQKLQRGKARAQGQR